MKRILSTAVLACALIAFIGAPSSALAAINVLNYWRMGEADPGATPGATATTAVDSVGGTNLIYVNHPATNSIASYSTDVPVSSNVTSTLSVNFTNQAYALAPIPSTLTGVVDDFGIEAWVKPKSTNGGVIAYLGSTATSGWGILLDSSRGTYAGLYGGVDLPGDGPTFATNAPIGVWQDVALVRHDGVSTLYVNGVAQPYQILAGPRPPAGNIGISTAPQVAGTQGFTGLIDEVRIFTFNPGQFSTTNLWVSTTITPPPPPTNRLVLGTTNLLESGAAGSDSVLLNDTLANNSWTAVANSSWLHVAGTNASGIGNALVVFSFDANPGATRTGTLTIAGQTVTVTQAPANYSPAQLVNNILPQLPSPSPEAMAVDPHGNLYFVDSQNSTIWERLAGSHSLTNFAISNWEGTSIMAADGLGNLYFASDSEVQEWSPGNLTVTNIITNLVEVGGLCVDSNNNVYVSDDFSNFVEVLYATNHLLTNLFYSTNFGVGALCADGAGSVYTLVESDGYGGEILQWTATNNTVSLLVSNIYNFAGFDLDGHEKLYVGSMNPTNSLGDVLEWDASRTNPVELFVGGNSHFSSMAVDAAGNVYFCPNGPYAAEQWAVSNQVIYPLVLAAPANINGFATDAAGNIYIVDIDGAAIEKWTTATGSYAPFITAPLQRPAAAVTDAAGNLYVADVNTGSVLKFNSAGTFLTTLASNLNVPNSLAFDGQSNLYILEDGNGDLLEWIATNNSLVSYIPSAILNDPQAVAMDVTGKIYLADRGGYSIDTWNPATQSVQPLWSVFNVTAVAVDGSGNIYTRDNSNGNILKLRAADGVQVTLAAGDTTSSGIALDRAGNLFVKAVGSQTQAAVIPNAYINANASAEGFGSGTGTLPMVVPSTLNLASLNPTTDASWLQIISATNGVIAFSFAPNTTGDPRTAHILVLGQSIAVTQPANPPTLINPLRVSSAVFAFTLTNLDTNHTYTVLMGTNLAVDATNWTVLGTATNAGNGLMRFTDTTATNAREFYIAH